jgi:hypothetical protein
MQLFEQKPFDSRTVMGFGILNGISIGLLNLCLGFNSVGFYQVLSLFFGVLGLCIDQCGLLSPLLRAYLWLICIWPIVKLILLADQFADV